MESLIDRNAPRTTSIREACKQLGIGQTTGYEMARRGEFPVHIVRVGKAWRVSVRGLRRFIDGADDDEPLDAA